MISGELAGIFERLGSNAENWQARLRKLAAGRLLGRFFAASRARLREVAERLGVHHLANLGGCGAPTPTRRPDSKLVSISLFRRRSEESGDLVVNYVYRDRSDHPCQFGMRSKPACSPGRTAVRGGCSLSRGNLAARHADCGRLVDQSGKKGWQELDGPQRGQVHPGLIWQDGVRTGPSSRERTWPSSFPGCQTAAGSGAFEAD